MFIKQSNVPCLNYFNSFPTALGIKAHLLTIVNALNDCANSPKPSQASFSFPQLAPHPILPFFLFHRHINLFPPQGCLSTFYLPSLSLASFFLTFKSQFLTIHNLSISLSFLFLFSLSLSQSHYFPSCYCSFFFIAYITICKCLAYYPFLLLDVKFQDKKGRFKFIVYSAQAHNSNWRACFRNTCGINEVFNFTKITSITKQNKRVNSARLVGPVFYSSFWISQWAELFQPEFFLCHFPFLPRSQEFLLQRVHGSPRIHIL